MSYDLWKTTNPLDEYLGPDPDDDLDECWNCHGEKVVYDCFSEYACIDPEGGCDLCERHCDVCRPPRKALGEQP